MSDGECCFCTYAVLLFLSAFGIFVVTTGDDTPYVFFHNGPRTKLHLQFSTQECDVFQEESVATDSRSQSPILTSDITFSNSKLFSNTYQSDTTNTSNVSNTYQSNTTNTYNVGHDTNLTNFTRADRRLHSSGGHSSGGHRSGGHNSEGHGESTGHVHTTVNVMHSGKTGYALHYSMVVSRTNRWIVVSDGFHMMMIMSDGSVKYVPSVGEMRFIKIMTIEPNDNYVELSGDSTSLYVCYADFHKDWEAYIIFVIMALVLLIVAFMVEAWCECGGRYPQF